MHRIWRLPSRAFSGWGPVWLAQAQPEKDETLLVVQARKSVVWLEPIFGGKLFACDGLRSVISWPGDGKKVIITSGHIFHEGMHAQSSTPGDEHLGRSLQIHRPEPVSTISWQ